MFSTCASLTTTFLCPECCFHLSRVGCHHSESRADVDENKKKTINGARTSTLPLPRPGHSALTPKYVNTRITEKTILSGLSRSQERKQKSLEAPNDFFWPTTVTASTGKYPHRSAMGLSLLCPKEASWEGRLPGIAPHAWLMSTRLGWKITDINRKAKQVERILSNRFSELTFAKIIHLAGYLHVSWS